MKRKMPCLEIVVSIMLASLFEITALAGAHSASSPLVTVDTRDSAVWSLAAPTGVNATKNWPTAVFITWNEVYGAAGYQVFRGPSSASSNLIATLGGSIPCRYSDTEPPMGQANYYRVRAVNGTNASPPSAAVQGCRNPSAAPTAPVGIYATKHIETEVRVQWTGLPEAESYNVFRNIENTNSGSVFLGSVEATVPGTVEFRDGSAMAGVEYWYYVQSKNTLGKSAFSQGVMGYAVGKPFERIEWDTERVKAYFGDEDPIRVVQVVDTGNTAIRTKRPFAVRAYLRTPTYQHASVTAELSVYDGTNLLATSVGTIFPKSAFRDWTSYSEMMQKHRLSNVAAKKTYELMLDVQDSLTVLIPAEKCPGSGNITLHTVVRCNGLELEKETTVGFVSETRGLTIVRVRVHDTRNGSPNNSIWDDKQNMISLVESVFPYKKKITIEDVQSDLMFDWDWIDSISWINEAEQKRLFVKVAEVAMVQRYDVVCKALLRGDHVVVVGIVKNAPGRNRPVGYTYANLPVIIAEGNDSSIRHNLAHELGHVGPFKLGDSYDRAPDSEYNKKSKVLEFRSPVGNYLLPNMGAMNVVSGLYNERTGILDPSDSCTLSEIERASGFLGKYKVPPYAILTIPVVKMMSDDMRLVTTGLMGGAGLDWVSAEPNEYKRFCDVLLPGAWGNKSVSSMSMMSALAPGVSPLSEVPSYTGAVVMATAVVTEGGEAEIWPLSSLGQMEVSEPVGCDTYSFVMLDAGSNLLDRIGFGFSSGSVSGMGSAIVPYRPESHILRLVSSNGVVLAEKVRSANAPTCAGLSCTATNDGYRIAWTGADADGDSPLWASLYYAREGTNFLGPIISMDTNSSVYLPAGIVPGGTGVVWKVVVSDGFNFGEGLSSAMTVSNVAPSCGFASGSPEYVVMGATNVYACFTSDPEDGQIPGTDVNWRQDGLAVTTGYQAAVCFETAGWHTLEIGCADSAGATGVCSMAVFAADTNATPVAAVRESGIVAVPGATVTLESASSDPNGDPLTYLWKQTAGTNVTLTGAAETNAVFVMPEIEAGGKLTFKLTVSDGSHTGFPATVTVTHYPREVTLSVPQIEFPYEGGRTSLTVQVAYDGSPWTVQCTSEWVRLLSPASGSGYSEIWFEAVTNTGSGREVEVAVNDKRLIVQQNGDTDGDGMPDAWERRYGLNPRSNADAVLDPDGDSLSNLAEYHAGTDPNNRDTDGDTLPDGWELVRGFSPLDVLRGLNGYAGMFLTGGTAEGVAVVSNLAFVADGTNGLVILDVSEPTNIVQVGACALEGFANGVAVAGGRAYVTCGTNGLAVVDVADAGNPAVLSVCALEGVSRGVCVASNAAFVASGEAGVHVVGVDEGGIAALVATFGTEGAASGVALAGSTLYVVDGAGGLLAVDAGAPASPALLGSCALTGPAVGVCVTGNTAYVAMGEQGLAVVDASEPSSMTVNSVCDTPGYALGVDVGCGFAFVADGGGGLQIAETGGGGTNGLQGSADTPGWAKGVCVRAGLAYVADGAGGLQIVQIAGIDENQNGIPDSVENARLGTLVADPFADSDGDGICNWGEYLAGMNMNSRDSDGDGMPDAWEIAQLFDPVRDDSQEDFDGDGFKNGAEYAADTDPKNAASLLRVDGLEFSGSSVIIHWRGGVAARRELMRATNLASNDWQVIERHEPPTPASGTTLDEAPPAQGFYKLRVTP